MKRYKIKAGMFLRAKEDAPYSIPMEKDGIVEVKANGRCFILSGAKSGWELLSQDWALPSNGYSSEAFRRVKKPLPINCVMVSKDDVRRIVESLASRSLFPGQDLKETAVDEICRELGL